MSGVNGLFLFGGGGGDNEKKEMRYKRRLNSVQMSSKLMEGALQTKLVLRIPILILSGYHADTPITIKAEPSIWPTAAFINIHEHPI